MHNDVLQDVTAAVAKNRRKSIWKRIVSVLACIVVFCTTYALILPALTLERTPECALEEHTHTEACYIRDDTSTAQVLICTAETLGLHRHIDDCVDLNGEYICGYSDFVIHSHNEYCFDENGVLVCTLPEIFPHIHTDICYLMSEDPASQLLGGFDADLGAVPDAGLDYGFNGIPGSGLGHIHTDECYVIEPGELICTLPTEAAHVHTDECYLNTDALVCTMIEGEGHIHADGCFDEAGALVCTVPESEGHTHTSECYQTSSSLICTLAEGEQVHVHNNECYAQARVLVCEIPEDSSVTDYSSALPSLEGGAVDGFAADAWLTETSPENGDRGEPACGMDEIIPHRHIDSCFDENGVIICGMTEVLEHIHMQECMSALDSFDELTCTVAEGEGPHFHTAEAGCFDEDGMLVCEIPESEGHVHGTICYGNWILICGIEEHTHTEDCYSSDDPEPDPDPEWEVFCGREEHTHAGECINGNGVVVCTVEEHSHSAECYVNTFVCGKVAHIHADECFDENGVMICAVEEHVHTEECSVDASAELIVFCGKEEHIHADECFDENGLMICFAEEHVHSGECYVDTSAEQETFCGKTEHVHGFECYDDDCALICALEDHIHTQICYTAETVEELLGFEPLATAYLVETDMLMQPFVLSDIQAAPRDAGAETDFTNYINKVTLQYLDGNSWKDAPADYTIKKGEQVRFKLDYILPARKLEGESDTIKYQLPDAFKNVDLSGGNVYNGATKIGSFTVSYDNIVHITFLPDYVESNADGNAIVGDVIIKAEIDGDKITGDNVNIDFGNGLTVDYDFDRTDVDWSNAWPEKTGAVIDRANGIIQYTIRVKTDHNGTTNPVDVVDNMQGVELCGTANDISVTTSEGQNVDCVKTQTANGFEITNLPPMAANTEYVITYNAKIPDNLVNSAVDIDTNNSVVTSTRRNDDKLVTQSDEFPLTVEQNFISKTGTLNGDFIDWKITINGGRYNIGGMEFNDYLNDALLTQLPLTMRDSANNEYIIDNWPYTFPAGSNDIYTIEYSTKISPKLEPSSETNRATIGNPDETPSESIAVVPLPELDPVDKNALSVMPSGDGNVNVRWGVTVTADKGDIPANWYYEDSLNYDGRGEQYISEGQFIDLCNAIADAVPADKTYTVESINQENKIRGFRINFTAPLKKGESFTFEYESTGVLTDSERDFGNTGNVNGKKAKQAWIKYYPSLRKVDTNNENGGSNTQHEYYEDQNRVGVVSWKIYVSPPADYISGDLKLIEHLPEGLTLTSFKVQLQDLWWTADLTDPGDNPLSNDSQYKFHTEISENGRDITITIPENIVKLQTPNRLNFEIQTKINDDAELFNRIVNDLPAADFMNTAELKYADGRPIDTKSQTQTITKDDSHPPISKSRDDNIIDNLVSYTVMVNQDGADLIPNNEYLDFKDIMKLKLASEDDKYTLAFDRSSFHVYKLNKDGSETELTTVGRFNIDSGKIREGGDWFIYSKMTMQLPDSTPLKVVYKYQVVSLEGKFGETKFLTNEASIAGVSSEPQDSKNEVSVYIQEIKASAATGGLTFIKVDADNYLKVLKDVEFNLWSYGDDGQYHIGKKDGEVIVYKPNSNGEITINNVPFNRAFYLEETKVPEGYSGLGSRWYFYVEDPAHEAVKRIPDNFEGHVYHGGNTYYITNEKETTEIEVIKRWHDKDGKDITATRSGQIEFDLLRYVLNENPGSKPSSVAIKTTLYAYGNFNNTPTPLDTINVPYNSDVSLSINIPENSAESEMPALRINGRDVSWGRINDGKTLYYSFKITGDVHIEINRPTYTYAGLANSVFTPQIKEPPTVSHPIETYGTYTISATSEEPWRTTITDLPRTGTDKVTGNTVYYTYFVREKEDGIQDLIGEPQYINNSGVRSDTITIINTVDTTPRHELPQTGGGGIAPITALGGGVIAITLILALIKKVQDKKTQESG